MSLKRSFLISLVAVLSLVALGDRPLAMSQTPSGPKVFTFGVMLPLSGPAGELSVNYQKGVDLAVNDVNAKGGINGWQLKSITVDHKGTALGGAQAMNQLVNLDKVPFVLTTFTAIALAAQPIAEQNAVVLFNIGGTSTNLLNKPWLYNDQIMGEPLNLPLAQYSYAKGARTAALLTSEDAYGKDDGIAFTNAFTKLGGKIVASETFPLTATDFTAQLTKIRASNPDVLYSVSVGDTQGLLVKQARALDVKAPMIGPLPTLGLITVGTPASEGFVGTGIAVDPTTKDPAAKTFFNEYHAKYNQDPFWTTGTAYEAVRYLAVLIGDITRAGGDPRNGATLLKAIEARPVFQNYLSGGQVHLLGDHGSTRALDLQVVKKDAFVTFKTVQPPK